MFGFIFKWITRGVVLASVATVAHSCGASHIYADDQAFSTPSASPAGVAPQGGRL